MNWSVDIKGGNRLLDHPFTLLSKQQLNLFSFSLLTSCSRIKKKSISASHGELTEHGTLFCPHMWWPRGGGRKEKG